MTTTMGDIIEYIQDIWRSSGDARILILLGVFILFWVGKIALSGKSNRFSEVKSFFIELFGDSAFFLLILAGGIVAVVSIVMISESFWARVIAVGIIAFIIIRKINKNKYENRQQ